MYLQYIALVFINLTRLSVIFCDNKSTKLAYSSTTIKSNEISNEQLIDQFANSSTRTLNEMSNENGNHLHRRNLGDTGHRNESQIVPTTTPLLLTPQLFAHETSILINNQTKKAGQDNTALAYESKIIEFKQYCHSVFASEGALAEIVTPDKAFGFVLYNAFCQKIKSTGRKKRGDGSVIRFDRSNYNLVGSYLHKYLLYTIYVVKYNIFC